MKKNKLLCMGLSILTLGGLLTGCDLLPSTPSSSESVVQPNETKRVSYLKMRINPEIELVIDEEEKIVSVTAVNEDGEVVLCEINLVGLTVEEAVKLFTSAAIELGYIEIDTTDATVYILTDGNHALITLLSFTVFQYILFIDSKGLKGRRTHGLHYLTSCYRWAICESFHSVNI